MHDRWTDVAAFADGDIDTDTHGDIDAHADTLADLDTNSTATPIPPMVVSIPWPAVCRRWSR